MLGTREPVGSIESDLRRPAALWPSRRLGPLAGSSVGSGRWSVELVLQLVQDTNHDFPEGLVGAAEGGMGDAQARTERGLCDLCLHKAHSLECNRKSP